ncbi:ABC transporter ATP-binding protein [Halosolutus halophilus]|uniref:ABC transporter ATP-binding protein n=1 Tax=Halosolutus halophilus TaxID=1552990 RepID=UPI002234F45E|nr:ABC transporter ATP-binding protein [Halosolutus halophilus]
MLLSTSELTKSFGGITAVDGVEFALEPGQLCSVIGPNGAGKTTFFNLITGELEPTSGTVEFDSSVTEGTADITTADPAATARLGLHRSYQITNIFPTMSVLENVRIAAQAHRGTDSWRFWRNVNSFEGHFEEARAILERIGLADDADIDAQNLSHGEKRSLEIGIALAGDPDLLLLDEPTAGVSSEDVGRLTDLIENIAADHSIMLIEHNMDIVMDISDRVVVLDNGSLIADGDPAAIRDSERVQRAYLGGYGDDELDGTESDDTGTGVATG